MERAGGGGPIVFKPFPAETANNYAKYNNGFAIWINVFQTEMKKSHNTGN